MSSDASPIPKTVVFRTPISNSVIGLICAPVVGSVFFGLGWLWWYEYGIPLWGGFALVLADEAGALAISGMLTAFLIWIGFWYQLFLPERLELRPDALVWLGGQGNVRAYLPYTVLDHVELIRNGYGLNSIGINIAETRPEGTIVPENSRESTGWDWMLSHLAWDHDLLATVFALIQERRARAGVWIADEQRPSLVMPHETRSTQ